jgi:hypothetical protein
MTPRVKLLGTLLVLALVLAFWQYSGSNTPAPDASPEDAATGRTRTPAAIPDQIVALRVGDLERQSDVFELGRNLFRFGQEPPPPQFCGDGSVNRGETCKSCPEDAGVCPTCPNGKMDPGETCDTCPADMVPACPPVPPVLCPNGRVDPGETYKTCPQDVPGPRPVPYGCLGLFGSPNHRLAVLINGKQVMNVQEGDVLDGEYVVAKIGLESVDIKWVKFPDEPAKRLAVGAKAGSGG